MLYKLEYQYTGIMYHENALESLGLYEDPVLIRLTAKSSHISAVFTQPRGTLRRSTCVPSSMYVLVQ